MENKPLYLICFLFLFSSYSFAQFSTEWTANFMRPDESNSALIYSKLDNAGNVYVACDAFYQNQGMDFVLIKYNSTGQEQWKVHYNNPANTDDVVYSMTMDNSGNIYMTGNSGDDMLIVKYNFNGILQWANLYRTPGSTGSTSNSVSLDNSGNIFIAGTSRMNANNRDMITVKYNSEGILQWAKTYDSPFHNADQSMKVLTDNSGNVYTSGNTTNTDWNSLYTLIKYNANGDEQWSINYDNTEYTEDDLMDMAIDNSGNIFLAGYSYDNNGSSGLVLKYNSSGILQWKAQPPSDTERNSAFVITIDNSGNVFTTGAIVRNLTNTEYYTVKYNLQGVFQWGQTYSGPPGGNDRAWTIAVDAFSNVYVAGMIKGTNTQYDFATVKYSSSGAQLWAATYVGDNQSNSFASSVNVDNSGHVYVSGYSKIDDIYDKVITIKYSQTSGIVNTSSNIPNKYLLSQNYPNPFNPATKINFSLPKNSFVTLKVFDLSGKEVANLVNENLSAGSYETDFNASDLTSGIYFYRLTTENFSETKKMILVK